MSLRLPRISTISTRRIIPWLFRGCTLLFLGWYLVLLYLPVGDATRVYGLTVPKGAGFAGVANELKQAGVIRSSLHLRLVARLRGLDRRMQTGDYRISSAMVPSQILEKLANGQTDACKFTLPEGYSIYQAAELLHKQGVFDRAAFLEACSDRSLLTELGINAKSVEGYLFPGTYQIGFHMDEAGLVTEMVRAFRHKAEGFKPLLDAAGMTIEQVVILASIIEREAVSAEEKPLIASVFLNRLRIGMPLQSDPTAIYGAKVFGGTVTKQDLQRTTLYNTYKVKGLPVGPIGNPGLEAMQAVLQPAKTDYLYFVARKNGTHQFSRTLAEHNQGVNRFLKKGAKKR
ncbi:UPF0755 protein [Trichlorobacter thiogenes]|uniref:Endolytic murein transglycosylase n=1 Tax=Trichlorobacter thiogenes TaxID=115783 RepID=A0A1T4NG03_9BACT|nr:endolytic transglycosylase MltG [Trichlorobacter thiogenes]SJZ78075.1 UPF0755 protein [Trichlorobacter thiogenes]